MSQTTWCYTGQSVIGTSHEKLKLPCQDAHCVEFVGNLFVAVIADGAGTAKYADIAATFATEEAIALIKGWRSVPENEQEWETRLYDLLELLRKKLEVTSDNINCSLRDLATTFLVVVVSEKVIASAQIGDGAVVYGVEHEEDLHLLTLPDHGEYLNETTFLISEDYQEHVQIVSVECTVDRVALMSDGVQMVALNMRTHPPIPYRPFFRPFFEFVRTVEDETERNNQLHDFLCSPRVNSRTDDDKTLVIAVRKE